MNVYQEKCRVCLSECPPMHALSAVYKNDLTLADMLKRLFNLQTNICNGFPKHLCAKCANLLIDFYNFSIVLEASTRKLALYLNSECELIENEDTVQEHPSSEGVSDNVVIYDDVIDNYQRNWGYNSDEKDDNKKDGLVIESVRLEENLKSQKQSEKYICEVCGYVSLKKSYLASHMEVHTLERQYCCEFCSKTFRRHSAFSRHRRIHLKPKQFVCEMCGQKFTDRGTLKTHCLLIHVKSRNFQCMICEQTFSLKATLEKHLRRHQQKEGAVKNFSCNICNTKYFDKSSLKRHFASKHHCENFTMESSCVNN